MGTSIIAHCNTSPVFDSTKHVFNFVALFIQIFVVGNSYFSGFPGRDARRDASFEQGIAEPIGIISSVSKEFLGLGEGAQQLRSSLVVTCLAGRQQKEDWLALAIANSVKFGVQSAFCPPDTAGKSPFLSKLAAVRWALRWVASIISRSVSPCFSTSSINILLKTPSLLQRMNLLYKVLCGPYSRGASFH